MFKTYTHIDIFAFVAYGFEYYGGSSVELTRKTCPNDFQCWNIQYRGVFHWRVDISSYPILEKPGGLVPSKASHQPLVPLTPTMVCAKSGNRIIHQPIQSNNLASYKNWKSFDRRLYVPSNFYQIWFSLVMWMT